MLAGGLVGYHLNTTISNSHASGNVTGSNDSVGGLVGVSYDEQAAMTSNPPAAAISGSTARGTVTGVDNVGGLVGWTNGTISDSAALNRSVTGVTAVGGLLGLNIDDEHRTNTIHRSIATANVVGTGQNVGGLVGQNHSPIA